MMTSSIPGQLSAKEKHELVWNHIVESAGGSSSSADDSSNKKEAQPERQWPSYNEVLQDVRKSDYNEILTCPLDLHPGKPEKKNKNSAMLLKNHRNKTICAQGVVCTAKMELFDFPETSKGRPYSGLLTPGTTVEHCLLRLSSALQPMDMGKNKRVARLMFGEKLSSAKIFPGVALKVFRTNAESGNALFLGCKVGQPEDDFFAHCLSSQLTSRMPVTLKPIVRIFKKYSQHPLALGLSNLCSYDAEGEMASDLNFPFCLTLKPKVKTNPLAEEQDDSTTLDSFLDDIHKIPPGTVLYDIFASPDPLSVADASKLQRIGRLVTTSRMKESPQDDGLFFRHQKKDEDFALRPHWKQGLDNKVVLKDGTKGTAATLAGWGLFEHQIHDGGYVDFEAK
jgi:hypothetical protein